MHRTTVATLNKTTTIGTAIRRQGSNRFGAFRHRHPNKMAGEAKKLKRRISRPQAHGSAAIDKRKPAVEMKISR